MSAQDIRVENLRALVAAAGTIAAFARQHQDIDATYVSQLLNGHRSFGERAARAMELKLGLAPGAIDMPAGASPHSNWPFPRLPQSRFERLTAAQKNAIEEWVIEQVFRFQAPATTPAPHQAPPAGDKQASAVKQLDRTAVAHTDEAAAPRNTTKKSMHQGIK